MVNVQKWYNKGNKKIEIKHKNKEELCLVGQQLIIDEEYSEVKEINLYHIESIDKVILKDLSQLQKCTIRECGLKELVIENCPQIKALNVRENSLSSLEFLANIENLEELVINSNAEIDSGLQYLPTNLKTFSYENTKLNEFLKPDWETCKKEREGLIGMVKQNPQQLVKDFWDLSRRHENLKRNASVLLTENPVKTKEITLSLKKEFKDKEAKINYLEFQVWELTNLNKQQKEKIQSYLDNFGSEKELLKKLIKTYLEFVKFKKQEIDSPDYYEKSKNLKKNYEAVEEDLEYKLPQESRNKTMNEVLLILTDCEELFEEGLKAEAELKISRTTNNDEELHIWERVKPTQQIINIFSSNQSSINITVGSVNQNNQFTYHIHYNEKELEKAKNRAKERQKKIEELSKLVFTESQEPTLEEFIQTPIYQKTIDFMKAKSVFLDARRETIEELQKCFNKWDKSNRKSEIFSEIGSTVSSIGGSITTDIITFGIPQALGEAIKAGSNFSKIVISEKGNKEFQIFLRDENELVQFNNAYNLLINLIHENEKVNNLLELETRILRNGEVRLFKKKYKIFDILVNDGVWKEKHLSFDKMGEAIASLNQNLKEELESEWEKQFDKLKLSREHENLIIQELKVQRLQNKLKELTNSVKDKLKSKNHSVKEREKRNEEREKLLEILLETQKKIIYSSREMIGIELNSFPLESELKNTKKKIIEVKKSVTKEELEKICQVQTELTQLQMELESLQEIQLQSHQKIPPK